MEFPVDADDPFFVVAVEFIRVGILWLRLSTGISPLTQGDEAINAKPKYSVVALQNLAVDSAN